MLALRRRAVWCCALPLARAFGTPPGVAAAPVSTVKSESQTLIEGVARNALPLRLFNEVAQTRDQQCPLMRTVALGVVRHFLESGRLYDAQRFFIGCSLLTFDDVSAHFFYGRVTLETFSAAFKIGMAKRGDNPHNIQPRLHFDVVWPLVRHVTRLDRKTRPLLHHLLMALEHDGFVYSDNLQQLQEVFSVLNTLYRQSEWADEAARICKVALRLVERLPPASRASPATMQVGRVCTALLLQWPLPEQTQHNLECARQLDCVVPALLRVVRNVPHVPGGSRDVLSEAAAAAGLLPTSIRLLEALYDLKLVTTRSPMTPKQAYVAAADAVKEALDADDAAIFEQPGFVRHLVMMMHRAESDADEELLRRELELLQTLQERLPALSNRQAQLSSLGLHELLGQFVRSRCATLQRRTTGGGSGGKAAARAVAAAPVADTPLEYDTLFRSEADYGRFMTDAQAMAIYEKAGLWDATQKHFVRIMTPEQMVIRMRCSIAQLPHLQQRQWEQSLVTHYSHSNLEALIGAYIAGRSRTRPALAPVSDLLHKSMVRLCEKQPSAELAEQLRVFVDSRPDEPPHHVEYTMLVMLYPSCVTVVQRCLDDTGVFRNWTFEELSKSVIRKFASEHDFVPLSFYMASKLPPPGVRAFMLYNTAVNGCHSERDLWRVANLWTDLRLFRDPDQVSRKYTQMHARAANRVMKERLLRFETTPESSAAEKEAALSRIEAKFKTMQQGQRQLDKNAVAFAASQWCAEVSFAGDTLWVTNRVRLETIVQRWKALFDALRESSKHN